MISSITYNEFVNEKTNSNLQTTTSILVQKKEGDRERIIKLFILKRGLRKTQIYQESQINGVIRLAFSQTYVPNAYPIKKFVIVPI